MTSSSDILKNVPDAKPVRVFLPIKESKERYRVQAVYQKTEAPRFNLLFQPGSLPTDAIDESEPCLINIDMGGPNISIEAMISSSSIQALEMMLKKTISHDQMREFFRVDATTQVISKSFQPEELSHLVMTDSLFDHHFKHLNGA